jgi:hypothetical protein
MPGEARRLLSECKKGLRRQICRSS